MWSHWVNLITVSCERMDQKRTEQCPCAHRCFRRSKRSSPLTFETLHTVQTLYHTSLNYCNGQQTQSPDPWTWEARIKTDATTKLYSTHMYRSVSIEDSIYVHLLVTQHTPILKTCNKWSRYRDCCPYDSPYLSWPEHYCSSSLSPMKRDRKTRPSREKAKKEKNKKIKKAFFFPLDENFSLLCSSPSSMKCNEERTWLLDRVCHTSWTRKLFQQCCICSGEG